MLSRLILRPISKAWRSAAARASSAERQQASEVAARWQLRSPRLVRRLGRRSGGNWLIEDAGQLFVLHRARSPRDYVDYQLKFVSFLKTNQFPLELPAFVPTAEGETIYEEPEACWTLRTWITGRATEVPNAADVERIAATVGELARMMERFDHGFGTGRFRLPIFESLDCGNPRLVRFLAERSRLVERDAQAVHGLPLQTIYNDWHSWNLVSREGQLAGLIDFDSIVEAPAIVDCVNALSFCLLSSDLGFDDVRDVFLRGYAAARPISEEERRLVPTLLVNRFLLPADRLVTHAPSRRESLLEWLV